MRIAVVHDYFTQMGGAEKVAEALMGIFPQAAFHSTVACQTVCPRLHGVPATLPGCRNCPACAVLPLLLSSSILSRCIA